MVRKKKKKKLTPLAADLVAVYGQQQWGNQWHLFTLTRHWHAVAGRKISCHSMPAFFRRDVLWVYVHDSIWMQQMQLGKPELLAKINGFLKGRQPIDDLRWMLQPAGLIDIPREKYISPPINVDPAAEKEFRIMADNIRDPDTREAFCNLWLRLTTKNNKQ
jgi:hypothetical protein